MNLDDACQAADTAVFAKTGQHLNDVQMFILQGALQGQTYEQIAASSHYSASYIKKFVGPELWQLLSQALGENVSKTNFQAALGRSLLSPTGTDQAPTPTLSIPPLSVPPLSVSPPPSQHLWAVPNVPVFFGRRDELDRLETWLRRDRCRLAMITGIGGIGKTSLAAKLARQVQDGFTWIIWMSLSLAPTVAEVVTDILTQLPGELPAEAMADNVLVSHLVNWLRRSRCLLVFDSVEGILRSGEVAGQYLPHCQSYSDLFRQLAQEDHQSCLLLIGREQPAALMSLAGDSLPVRHYRLRGLSADDARPLLAVKGVCGEQTGVEELVQIKRGNPLALQIVATTIQELFDGNIAQFLKHGTLIIGDTLLHLLDEQFDRLSDAEKGILYWLALRKQSLDGLRNQTQFVVSSASELLTTLQSLKRRSLVEEETTPGTDKTIFSLQPVVARYVLKQLVKQTSDDLFAMLQAKANQPQFIQPLGVLRSHRLFEPETGDRDSEAQTRLIQTIVNQLIQELGDHVIMRQSLVNLQLLLQDKPVPVIGYAMNNLSSLLRLTESELL